MKTKFSDMAKWAGKGNGVKMADAQRTLFEACFKEATLQERIVSNLPAGEVGVQEAPRPLIPQERITSNLPAPSASSSIKAAFQEKLEDAESQAVQAAALGGFTEGLDIICMPAATTSQIRNHFTLRNPLLARGEDKFWSALIKESKTADSSWRNVVSALTNIKSKKDNLQDCRKYVAQTRANARTKRIICRFEFSRHALDQRQRIQHPSE